MMKMMENLGQNMSIIQKIKKIHASTLIKDNNAFLNKPKPT